MGKRYVREVEFYRDVTGRSDLVEALKHLSRTDERAVRAIDSRLDLLRQVDLREAVRGRKLVKQPTSTICVLRVQMRSGFVPAPVLRIPL